MTARKKAEPTETKAEPSSETTAPEPSPSTAVGGLAELQAVADADAARGYKGPEEDS